jgi:hypothetical protein
MARPRCPRSMNPAFVNDDEGGEYLMTVDQSDRIPVCIDLIIAVVEMYFLSQEHSWEIFINEKDTLKVGGNRWRFWIISHQAYYCQ